MNTQKLIEKQDELIEYLSKRFEFQADDKLIIFHRKWANLLSELAAFRQEPEPEEETAEEENYIRPNLPVEIVDEGLKCDVCGNHPSIIITTQFGRFCELHARYV
jgi:hypothetical protein